MAVLARGLSTITKHELQTSFCVLQKNQVQNVRRRRILAGNVALTLSRPGGALCAPSPKSQHIFKTAWSLELLLCEFFLCIFHSEKFSSTNQPSCVLRWPPCNFLAYFRKLVSPLFFKYFHLRETFCRITFYALDIIIL